MGPRRVVVVLQLPAVTAEVAEARQVPTIVRPVVDVAAAAQVVLQVRVDLHLLREHGRLDQEVARLNRLHVGLRVVEGHATRAQRILELVHVDARVDDAPEQVVHDQRQSLGREFAVQSAHEDGLCGVQDLRREDVMGVGDVPRNHLHVLRLHVLPGELVKVLALLRRPAHQLTRREEVAHLFLVLEDDVHAALGLRREVGVLARPLDAQRPEAAEDVLERLLGGLPGNSAKEDLLRVRDRLRGPRGDHPVPRAHRVGAGQDGGSGGRGGSGPVHVDAAAAAEVASAGRRVVVELVQAATRALPEVHRLLGGTRVLAREARGAETGTAARGRSRSVERRVATRVTVALQQAHRLLQSLDTRVVRVGGGGCRRVECQKVLRKSERRFRKNKNKSE